MEFDVNKTLGFTLFDVKPSVCFANLLIFSVYCGERKMNLSRIPPYISLLYFDLTLSTPNSPQPICIVSPCVALGNTKIEKYL